MFFIFFCTFFAFYLVVSKLFTNFAAGNQIMHTYDAMGNWQMTTYYTRKVALVENHRDRTIDSLNQRTVPCTSKGLHMKQYLPYQRLALMR